MPNDPNATPLTGEIKVGESLQIEQAPSIEASPASGEETSVASKHEESVQPAEKAVTEMESKAFQSGAKKARQLGESRRQLAKTLLEAAKSSHEVREQVKTLAAESPDLEKYLQKHFSKEYQVIFKDRLESEVEAEELEMKDREKAKARAELLVETLQEDKNELAEDLAAKLHFTRSQTDALIKLAKKLEGEDIGDEQLTWEKAIEKAALTISPQKAKVGITSLPSGMPSAEFEQQEIKSDQYDRIADVSKKLKGGKKDQIVENLKIVDKNFKNGVFQLPME